MIPAHMTLLCEAPPYVLMWGPCSTQTPTGEKVEKGESIFYYVHFQLSVKLHFFVIEVPLLFRGSTVCRG